MDFMRRNRVYIWEKVEYLHLIESETNYNGDFYSLGAEEANNF